MAESGSRSSSPVVCRKVTSNFSFQGDVTIEEGLTALLVFFAMKSIHWILFLAVFSVTFAATPVKKIVPAKTSSKKAVTKKAVTKKAVRRTKGAASPMVTSSSRSHQAVPTPERYKEIQEALTAKGYLNSEPNGVWDARSTDALRQFQAENKLSPTGKLSSASLIGLGLGPKNTPTAIAPAPVVPQP